MDVDDVNRINPGRSFLGLPSFGQTFLDALQRQDQSVITSILLFYQGLLVIETFISDLQFRINDPHIRYA